MITTHPIPGYPGYLATSEGQVIGKRTGLPMAATSDRDGYLQVTVRRDGKGYSRRVHTLVALAFLPAAPAHWTVDHGPGGKQDNRPNNLRWIERERNSREGQTRLGRRLSAAQVEDIRLQAQAGVRYIVLAKKYNRAESTIWKIAHRQRYTDTKALAAPYRWSTR